MPAAANAGIPMLVLAWPAQGLAFVPVVAIESLLIAHAIGTTIKAQFKPVVVANLISTIVGVPLAWLGMLALEGGVAGLVFGLLPESVANLPAMQYVLFPFMSAWIGGSSKLEFQAAFVVLSIPFCAISIYTEFRFLRVGVASHSIPNLKRAVTLANVLTYTFLCFFVVLTIALTVP